ncbi:MAG: hypothetical protein Ct9H300mP1_14000 [Planctomycetaceae bacterium]|nr:MAG: hypothetical protein Ct9H300mP1_14000 [Planctomycetaceae bacterium]
MDLARDRDIAAELKFTDEQAESISEPREKSAREDEKYQSFNDRIEAAKDDEPSGQVEAERTAAWQPGKASEADLAKLISAEQFRPCKCTNSSGGVGDGGRWVRELNCPMTRRKNLKRQSPGTISSANAAKPRSRCRNRDLSRRTRQELGWRPGKIGRSGPGDPGGLRRAEDAVPGPSGGRQPLRRSRQPRPSRLLPSEAGSDQVGATPAPADRGAKVVGNDGEPAQRRRSGRRLVPRRLPRDPPRQDPEIQFCAGSVVGRAQVVHRRRGADLGP